MSRLLNIILILILPVFVQFRLWNLSRKQGFSWKWTRYFLFFSLANLWLWVLEFLFFSPLTQRGFHLVVADRLKSMLYLYQNIFCCCTRKYIDACVDQFTLFFLRSIPIFGELLTSCLMIRDFCLDLIFRAPKWHFQCNFENDQVNVWSKHKARWLANIWF